MAAGPHPRRELTLTPRLGSLVLERELRRQLNDARRIRNGRRDLAECRRVASHARIAPLKPVERVEGLRPDFDLFRTADAERARQRHVEVLESGPAHDIADRIA